MLHLPYSTRNPISIRLPKLVYEQGGMLDVPGINSRAGFDTHYVQNLFNIWRGSHIHESLKEDGSAFSSLRLLKLSPKDAEDAMHGSKLVNIFQDNAREAEYQKHGTLLFDDDFAASATRPLARIRKLIPDGTAHDASSDLMPLTEISENLRVHSPLANPSKRAHVKPAVAPPIELICSDRTFTNAQEGLLSEHLASTALSGLPPPLDQEPELVNRMQLLLPGLPARGLVPTAPVDQLPAAGMKIPQMDKLIVDSSKLARLDSLLRELKANDHRVLIYFQMTKMIDLMEEYLIYRQYKYLRLDGASKISDRRDMVTDWQTKPDLFIFLLSTRAGGLGINLTAADTVVFYDHDWNPSNDSQAMDRAHRLGQTKQVTVYRLITKNTIDERIVKLARNKKEVQDIVVGNKAYSETGMARPQEIVSLLLDDDELAESMLKRKQAEEAERQQAQADNMRALHVKQKLKKEAAAAAASIAKAESALAWSLEDDEDDFFGAKPPTRTQEEPAAAAAEAAKGTAKASKKRKTPAAEGAPAVPKKRGGSGTAGKKAAAAAATTEGVLPENGTETSAPPPRTRKPSGGKRTHKKKSVDDLAGLAEEEPSIA